MSKIDYAFRLNKQVERKIIIDILSELKNELPISQYQYVGMGAVYFYDFILIHKAFGINKQVSIEQSTPADRFLFNMPYDFIKFENILSTDYLKKHDWQIPSIIWLDYEISFIEEGSDFVLNDLILLAKHCNKNDIVFVTINSQSPKEADDSRKIFLEKYKKYISADMFHIKNTTRKNFPLLIQDIWINILKEAGEYNLFKFHKTCSFKYKDGAEMYTLGGIFTGDKDQLSRIISLHKCLNQNEKYIQDINTPNVTQKERNFLNSKINALKSNASTVTMPFPLPEEDIKNYIQNYRYIPSYIEGLL